jgi:hypothetical protein
VSLSRAAGGSGGQLPRLEAGSWSSPSACLCFTAPLETTTGPPRRLSPSRPLEPARPVPSAATRFFLPLAVLGRARRIGRLRPPLHRRGDGLRGTRVLGRARASLSTCSSRAAASVSGPMACGASLTRSGGGMPHGEGRRLRERHAGAHGRGRTGSWANRAGSGQRIARRPYRGGVTISMG